MAEVVFVGVPYYLGIAADDTGAVAAVKAAGVAAELGAAWVDLAPDFAAHDDPVVAVNRALADAIAAHPGKIPFIIAADCTSCLGAMKGLEQHDPRVLWLDAHGDFNTPETTPSGFLGGMPLAALVGLGNQHLMSGIDLRPIPDSHVTLTDARDLDPAEADLVRQSNMTVLLDPNDVTAQDWQNAPLYIHFDIDYLRLSDMPAVGYPAAGGPSIDEALAGVRHAAESAQVVGVLFSVWNNALDGADTSRANTLDTIRRTAAALG